MMDIFPIPAFRDNYIWALFNEHKDCLIVDPGEQKPVDVFLQRMGLSLSGILVTHHHPDHIGAVAGLAAKYKVPVYGPANENIPAMTHPLQDGDNVQVKDSLPRAEVIDVPGHTAGHIAFFCPGLEPPVLFAGDTLFAGGCGRLFEGSPAQMLASLDRLAALPPETRLCCAHEYTQANLRFALAVTPDNEVLTSRANKVAEQRQQGLPSLPTTLEEEIATNPFMRVDSPDIRAALAERTVATDRTALFAELRQWKDNF